MEHIFKRVSPSQALKEILEKHKSINAPSIAESFGLTEEVAQEILKADLSGGVNSIVEEMTEFDPSIGFNHLEDTGWHF